MEFKLRQVVQSGAFKEPLFIDGIVPSQLTLGRPEIVQICDFVEFASATLFRARVAVCTGACVAVFRGPFGVVRWGFFPSVCGACTEGCRQVVRHSIPASKRLKIEKQGAFQFP